MAALNYKHLHYFWVVAKAGSITQASQQLYVTPQTISGQLTLFEDLLGEQLFTREGRKLQLTERGRMVLSYADEIFSLGQELEDELRQRPSDRLLHFRIGVCDAVPKVIAYRLIEPAMRSSEHMRIICREGNVSSLLAELAVHRLDFVIADSPIPPSINVRAFSHRLGECGISFFATKELIGKLSSASFPQCLDGAPLLVPGNDDAVRPKLMSWLESNHIRPKITGEFDDGALMKAFGQAGAGVFVAPSSIAQQVQNQFGVINLGEAREVTTSYYAISVERKLTHPAAVAIRDAAQHELFI
jgi:LysR family transcriptional regulator, transcriptional activator of nhaA